VTTAEQHLWVTVERSLGFEVPEQARQFCGLRGLVGDYFAAGEATDSESEEEWRSEALETIRLTILALKDAGYLPLATLVPTVPDDARWPLLCDLSAASERLSGWRAASGQPYRPFRVGRMLDFTVYPPASFVSIQVDNRMSMRTVVCILREMWPRLVEDGWVRRTRPLGDRAIALLRFVSLQTPKDAAWRDRQSAWNEAFADRGWAFADVRAFERAFRRAEVQLTGTRNGLHELRDSTPRKLPTVDDLLKPLRWEMDRLREVVARHPDAPPPQPGESVPEYERRLDALASGPRPSGHSRENAAPDPDGHDATRGTEGTP